MGEAKAELQLHSIFLSNRELFVVKKDRTQTHCAFVWLLSWVDSHVNQQFVTGIKWLEPSRAPCPEAGKVFSLPLVYVDLLYVPHKLLLMVIQLPTVNPATAMLAIEVLQLSIFLQRGARGRRQCLQRGDVAGEAVRVPALVSMVRRGRPLRRRRWQHQGWKRHVNNRAREVTQLFVFQDIHCLAVHGQHTLLDHHVICGNHLQAGLLQLLQPLVLPSPILSIPWKSDTAIRHVEAFLGSWNRAVLWYTASSHSQKMSIDLRLWGDVCWRCPGAVDVGHQRSWGRTNDCIELDPNAVRQRRCRECSLFGAGWLTPDWGLARTRVRRILIFHAI